MSEPTSRPVITVLCGEQGRPAQLGDLAERATLRYTDAVGLGDALEGASALLLWDYFSTALRRAWPRADRLRWIHVAAAGVDTLLFEELTDSPVVVTNARGIFDRPIAEFTLLSMLAHAKDAYRSYDLQNRRRWQHRETALLAGSAALIVGTGAIGREIARLLTAVGVQVRGIGSRARSGDADFGTVHSSTELAEHAGWADYLIVVAPLTERTRGLVDASVLARMRPDAYLVNVGRGECVVEADLLAALRAGHLGGAALDVFGQEPLPADHPLWTQPGVIISPHMAGDAIGWHDRLARQFLDNAERFLDGRTMLNVVDKKLGYVAGPPR